MKKLQVPDMHCGHCEERVGKALDAAGISHTINLEDRTVSIAGDEASVRKAVEALDDIGYEAKVAE